MKQSLYILFLILFVSFITSCKKTPPIEETNTSTPIVFAVTGACLGYNIDYKAGDDNYYMYSNYDQLNASPFNFNSVLKQNNCTTNCPFSVGITLTAQTFDTIAFNPNSSFNNSTSYSFYADSSVQSIIFDTNQINVFFTDINGTRYDSQNVQFQNGYFNIISVQDFNNNELGQKTKKVSFELSCLVSSQYTFQSSDSLVLSGSFAFAYPSP